MPGSIYNIVWGRTFSLLYDTAFILAEKRGLREIRRELLSQARGTVVELAAGTGLNVPHYTAAVNKLILTEPDPFMSAKLRKRVNSQSSSVSVLEASAEVLPIEDASVDTVVSTLVLCTVRDPIRTLSEIARILRPGGKFLFVEHVRSEHPTLSKWQDRLNTSWDGMPADVSAIETQLEPLAVPHFELLR